MSKIKSKQFSMLQVVKRFPPSGFRHAEISNEARTMMLGELAAKMFQSEVFHHQGQPIILQLDWNQTTNGAGGDTIVSVTANIETILL